MAPFIDDEKLDRAERLAMEGGSALHQYCGSLVSEVRRLRHELNDPNYMYSGRIHRQAILVRNAEIDALREELKKLREGK